MDQCRKGPLPHFVRENGERVVLCIAGMHDHRQPCVARNANMHSEQIALNAAIRFVIVIIEPRLTYSDHPRVLTSRAQDRSEERRGGKECGSTGRSRWSPYN